MERDLEDNSVVGQKRQETACSTKWMVVALRWRNTENEARLYTGHEENSKPSVG